MSYSREVHAAHVLDELVPSLDPAIRERLLERFRQFSSSYKGRRSFPNYQCLLTNFLAEELRLSEPKK